MLFFHLLVSFINRLRIHHLLFVSFDYQYISRVIFFSFHFQVFFPKVNTRRRLDLNSTLWERYSTALTHMGLSSTTSVLFLFDFVHYVVEACAVRFVLLFIEAAKTFGIQVTKMETLVMVSEHHLVCNYTTYVEGYLLFFSMNVATSELGFIQPLPILNLFWVRILINVVKILEDFTHVRRGCVRTKKIPYSLQVSMLS